MQPQQSPGMAVVRPVLVLLILLTPALACAQTTVYQYSAQDNPVARFDVDGYVTAMTYDSALSELVIDTQSGSSDTTTLYQTGNEIVGSFSNASEVTSTAYDPATNTIYNAEGELILDQSSTGSMVQPPINTGGIVASIAYDSTSNTIVAITLNPSGQGAVDIYNADGDLMESDPLQPEGKFITQFIDEDGNDAVVTQDSDGKYHVTVYNVNDGSLIFSYETQLPITDGVYVPEADEFGVAGGATGNWFFDLFPDLGEAAITTGPPTYTAMLADAPAALAYDSGNNTFYVAVAPESGSLVLIAPALFLLIGLAFRRTQRARAR